MVAYDGKVFVCRWNNNSLVNIASNYFTQQPIHKASRRMKQQTNAIIDKPFFVKQYNWKIGGVDIMDRLLGSYRSIIHGKKGYFLLVTNASIASIVGAWHLHCALLHTPMSHIQLRCKITLCLLRPLSSILASSQKSKWPRQFET